MRKRILIAVAALVLVVPSAAGRAAGVHGRDQRIRPLG
jgi:hypothetical protein